MRRAGHRPFRSRGSRNTGRPPCARSGGRPVHPRVRHWRGCRIRLAVHPQPREGEKAVREAFPATTLIRPSIMFGRGDAFLIPIARMLRRLPVFPLFGQGQTQLQPAYVEDVADAIARVMQNAQSLMCYELGGPRVYTYRLLLEVIARHLSKKPRLVPMPFSLWHALASVAEMLPERPITRNQVELMQLDNVASPGAPGFGDFGISSTSLEDALPAIVGL